MTTGQSSFSFLKWWLSLSALFAILLAVQKAPPLLLVLALPAGFICTLLASTFHSGSEEGRAGNNVRRSAVKALAVAIFSLIAGYLLQIQTDRWFAKVGSFVGLFGVYQAMYGIGILWGAWRRRKGSIESGPRD